MLNHHELVVWATRVMAALAPDAPWADAYALTAESLVKVAEESPLYARQEDGVRRTLAQDLGIAFYESTFKPNAEGDCRPEDSTKTKLCKPGARGRSVCLFQVHESNHKALGVTREELLTSVEVCARAAHTMMRASFAVCRSRPLEERLSQYAYGGSTCGGPKNEGVLESRHRMGKALWIFRNHAFLEGFDVVD